MAALMPLRVLICAQDPLARAGLAALLGEQPQLQIVGQLAPASDLLVQIAIYQPDALLWDFGWDAQQALSLLEDFAKEIPPVVMLAPDETTARRGRDLGAVGLLFRQHNGDILAAAIQAVASGLIVLDPEFTSSAASPGSYAPPPLEPLTPRELEVLQRMAEGLSNKLIARDLAISEHTVKFHINAILGKLGVQSRTEAVVRATRAGLIML